MRLRNIFDPTRLRDPVSEGAPRPATVITDSGRSPFFALTGTLLRPDKVLGFFAGSSSDMNRVLGPGETIAGYTIRSVTLSGADLEKDGKTLPLPVGQQIRLSGSNAGTAQPYFAPDPSPAAPSSFSSSPSPPPSFPSGPPPPAAPGSMPPPPSSSSSSRSDHGDSDRHKSNKSPEEILRKMMERAQRERTK
jgi:hypothetical protein